MIITVRHGFETKNLEFEHSPTIGEIRRSTEARVATGFRENDRALINGVEQPDEAYVEHGQTIVFETRANSKAVAVTVLVNA